MTGVGLNYVPSEDLLVAGQYGPRNPVLPSNCLYKADSVPDHTKSRPCCRHNAVGHPPVFAKTIQSKSLPTLPFWRFHHVKFISSHISSPRRAAPTATAYIIVATTPKP